MTKSLNFLLPAMGALMAIAAAGQGTAFVQIEGTIKGSHGVPMSGMVLRLPDGTSSVSNRLGHYTLLAPSGFTGSVTATDPTAMFGQIPIGVHNYTNITSDQTNQDFTFGRGVQGFIQPPGAVPVSTNDGQFETGNGSFSFDQSNDHALVVTPQFPASFLIQRVFPSTPTSPTFMRASQPPPAFNSRSLPRAPYSPDASPLTLRVHLMDRRRMSTPGHS